jgi:hypothetical protein
MSEYTTTYVIPLDHKSEETVDLEGVNFTCGQLAVVVKAVETAFQKGVAHAHNTPKGHTLITKQGETWSDGACHNGIGNT